ncbi:MAG: DUF2171 domain-containing protein [Candidatus Dormibacteraeota bacterium]|nr:DUF2171 domain-containing protein [Candidatus Dormibacteraeota bacterium]
MTEDDEEVVSWLAAPQHAPVIASDGHEVGRVVDAAGLKSDDIFHGIVFQPTGISRKHVLAPASDVARITNRAVYLSVDAATAETYEDFERSL